MTTTEAPNCARCGERCQQNWFEVQPDFWVCFHCITDAELERFFDPSWWETS
jgi:formylmethanofuran dehydrogenase subunit E